MEVGTDFSLIQKVHEGIDIAFFDKLLEQSGMTRAELTQLIGVDPKTIDNYRRVGKPFDTLKGELLLKLSRLFALGEEVFGSTKEFRAWLHLPAGEFQGIPPHHLLSTSTGVDLVEAQLERIAQGYVV